MDLNAIYTELILEHSQNSHNKHRLPCADCEERGHNPSCGDDITIELKFDQDKIDDAAFTGNGCAISQASTSMMIDLVRGKSAHEAQAMADKFIGMIKREIADEKELEILEDAIAFKNISNMPARVKCAVLAWYTLMEAIRRKQGGTKN